MNPPFFARRTRDSHFDTARSRSTYYWGDGAITAVFVAFASLVAIAPGRIAAAAHQMPSGHLNLTWLVTAICSDAAWVIPPGFAIAFLAAAAGRWGTASARARRATMVFSALVCFASTSFAEFRIQRGEYPVWADLLSGADVDFIVSSLGIFAYRRHLYGIVFAVVALIALRTVWRRTAGRPQKPFAVAGYLVIALLVSIATRRVSANALAKSTVGEPFPDFFAGLTDAAKRGIFSPRRILLSAPSPDDRVAEGAALLGLPPPRRSTSCSSHPYARPFSFDDTRAKSSASAAPKKASGAALLASLERLSQLLFENRTAPFTVYQMALETFRGDDIHAINPQAPEGIAPFVTSLYRQADTGGPILASRHMWQSGVRTSQAISALTCGLGNLPYSLSFSRELSDVPMRCLPDVLRDAGLSTHFFYAGDATFDRMEQFFRLHGVADVTAKWQLPVDLPKSAWNAASDIALFNHGLTQLGSVGAESRYAFFLSLSNHSPFQAPQDLPADVAERVREAVRTTPNTATPDDVRRLTTHSYTDEAVRRFFDHLARTNQLGSSIVILSADHSVGEACVWPMADGSSCETDEALAIIPFAIALSDEWIDRASNPKRLRDQIAVVNQELSTLQLSASDIPSLVLSLLSKSPGVKQIPHAWRWHSMGGAATSPWFHSTQYPDAALHLTHGASQLFFLNADGHPVSKHEPNAALQRSEDLERITPSLQPVAATLASLLKGHGDDCADTSSIRRVQ